MTRALLAVMAGLFCALAGIKHAVSLRQNAARLARWIQLLQHLSLLLDEGTLSIPEALTTAADGSSTADRLLRDMAMNMANASTLSISEAFLQYDVSLPERDLLGRMFTRLGRGSKRNRILAVDQTAQELRLMADAAAVQAEKDVKLWQTLGLICGACVTIMLL